MRIIFKIKGWHSEQLRQKEKYFPGLNTSNWQLCYPCLETCITIFDYVNNLMHLIIWWSMLLFFSFFRNMHFTVQASKDHLIFSLLIHWWYSQVWSMSLQSNHHLASFAKPSLKTVRLAQPQIGRRKKKNSREKARLMIESLSIKDFFKK